MTQTKMRMKVDGVNNPMQWLSVYANPFCGRSHPQYVSQLPVFADLFLKSVWSKAHVQTHKPLSAFCDPTRTIFCARARSQSHSRADDRLSPNIAHSQHVSHRVCLCVVD